MNVGLNMAETNTMFDIETCYMAANSGKANECAMPTNYSITSTQAESGVEGVVEGSSYGFSWAIVQPGGDVRESA